MLERLKFIFQRVPFKFIFSRESWCLHDWYYWCDGLKRKCNKCGRVEWLFEHKYPAADEPQYIWEEMINVAD